MTVNPFSFLQPVDNFFFNRSNGFTSLKILSRFEYLSAVNWVSILFTKTA